MTQPITQRPITKGIVRSGRALLCLFSLCLGLLGGVNIGHAQDAGYSAGQPGVDNRNYTVQEIVSAGHDFFGTITGGLASAVERAASKHGLPNGYILGEEGSAAFVAGARYGEGHLHTKNMGVHKIFWQGPSVGLDFGGDGNRTMMLVYNLPSIDYLYRRWGGVNGSAYLIGGFGMTLLSSEQKYYIIPIRSGVGARVGLNFGYLKFSQTPTWNPF